MKYLILAAILITTASTASAESSQESTAASLLGTISSGHRGHIYKNVENAHEREDAIKANLDEKSDGGEQKAESTEE